MIPDRFAVTPFIQISRRNPYAGYAKLRALGPWFQMANHGPLLISGHALAVQAFKEPRLERKSMLDEAYRDSGDPAMRAVVAERSPSMLFANPPHHGRIRGFMSRAFQPRLVERMRESTTKVAEALLDAGARKAKGKKKLAFDAIADFAGPLPVKVIAHMIGVPEEDFDRCVAWSDQLAPVIDAYIPREIMDTAQAALEAFALYIRQQLEERRARPRDDILTALIQARDSGAELSEDELISNVITLFVAGHETTTNTIGHAFALLHQFPDARAELEAQPDKLVSAVEEILRYEPTIQMVTQWPSENLMLGDLPLRKGQPVWLMLGAANRDPEKFTDPERFDIARTPNPHIAFGSGAHTCIGAALARLEVQVALSTLMARYPKWRVTEQAFPLRETTTLRGYARLEVALR